MNTQIRSLLGWGSMVRRCVHSCLTPGILGPHSALRLQDGIFEDIPLLPRARLLPTERCLWLSGFTNPLIGQLHLQATVHTPPPRAPFLMAFLLDSLA